MKSVALKLGVCLLALTLVVGCATAAKGASDQEQIKAQMGKWKDALQAKNLDAFMAVHSDNYAADGRDKAGLKDFVGGAINDGMLNDAAIDVESATVTVNGDKAVVTPVKLEGQMGLMTLYIEMAKENGQWLVTSTTGQ